MLSSQTSHVYYQAARVVCLYPQFRSRDISQFFLHFSHHVKDPRRSWILDSTPWIPDSRYKITDLFQWNLDSRYQLSVGLRIPTAVLWIPRPRIPDSTCKISRIPESGFSYMARNFRYIHIQRHVKFMKRQRKVIHFTKKAPRGLKRLTSQVKCTETVKKKQNNRRMNWKVIVQLLTTRSDEKSSFVNNKQCPTHINSPWYSRLN